jgi:uncharacterized protein DUF4129
MAVALFLGALCAVAAAAPSEPVLPRDPGARARTILADPRYQRAFPGSTPGDKGRDVWWRHRGPAGDVAPGDRAVNKPPELPFELAVVAGWLLLLLSLAVLALVAVWGARSAREARWRRRSKDAAASAAVAPERRPERAGPDFADADRLAAEERWTEALHALLLQAIRFLTAGSPVALRPSYTSRELLRLIPLSGEAQKAFAGLVRAVELSLFGGAEVGPDQYRENRERFQLLLGGTR